MKILFALFILISTQSFSQQKFDTIYVVNFVSNPPISDFICDTGKCEGFCASYYNNGQTYMKGKFENGQPIDSLFKFYSDGQLEELFEPNEKGWKKTTYFKNRQVQTIYDVKNQFEKEYYSNGQLKKESSWSKKYASKKREYFPNGQLKTEMNNKRLNIYNETGVLVEKIKRKEILILDRIFTREPHSRNSKFYEYTWESFDSLGVLKRKIIFNNDGFLMSPFPDNTSQIDDFLFTDVTFYKNGIAFKKIEFKYIKENDKLVKKLHLYRKEQDEWIEEEITTMNKVYEIIAAYSK